MLGVEDRISPRGRARHVRQHLSKECSAPAGFVCLRPICSRHHRAAVAVATCATSIVTAATRSRETVACEEIMGYIGATVTTFNPRTDAVMESTLIAILALPVA